MDEKTKKALESIVATILRDHVAPIVFQNEQIRASLGPQRLAHLQAQINETLEQAISQGLEERARLKSAIFQGVIFSAFADPLSQLLVRVIPLFDPENRGKP